MAWVRDPAQTQDVSGLPDLSLRDTSASRFSFASLAACRPLCSLGFSFLRMLVHGGHRGLCAACESPVQPALGLGHPHMDGSASALPGPHRGTVSAQHILVCQAVASVISCAGATGCVSELLTLCGHGELSSGAFISKGPCCDSSVQLQVTWEEAENTRTKSRASQGNGTGPCLLEPKTKLHEPTSARGRSALGMTRASALQRVRERAAGKTALALTFFTLSFCLTLASSNLCFLGSFPPAIKKPHKPSVRVACHQCKGEVEGGVSERRELLLSAPGGGARRRLANSSGPHLTSCFNYSFCNSRHL